MGLSRLTLKKLRKVAARKSASDLPTSCCIVHHLSRRPGSGQSVESKFGDSDLAPVRISDTATALR